MLRQLAASALLVLTVAPVALAEDSNCKVTYNNDSGIDFVGSATVY